MQLRVRTPPPYYVRLCEPCLLHNSFELQIKDRKLNRCDNNNEYSHFNLILLSRDVYFIDDVQRAFSVLQLDNNDLLFSDITQNGHLER